VKSGSNEHGHRCLFCKTKYDCYAAHARASRATWPGMRCCADCREFNLRAIEGATRAEMQRRAALREGENG